MLRFRYLPLLLLALSSLPAEELRPETAAAFDRYVRLTEEGFAKDHGYENFLWLDHHPKEKTMVWLQQSIVQPMQTLDHGAAIEVPGGVIQHWLGVVYLENADADHVHGLLGNFAGYKDFFHEQIIDSKVIRHEGDQSDYLLRFHKKQFNTVVLNVEESAKYTKIDDTHWTIASRSTKVAEAEHPKNKKKLDEDRPPEDDAGYLWRLNLYWRVQQSDNGCYVELELISLGREESGRLHPSRYMANFQNFPHQLTAYLIDTLDNLFPHRH